MINLKSVRALAFATVALVTFFCLPTAFSQDENTGGASSSSSSSSSTDASSSSTAGSSSNVSSGSSAGVSTSGAADQLTAASPPSGAGLFQKLPFQLSMSLREGYDDNPSNISQNKQGSWFTNGGVTAAYIFGNPRLQLNFTAGAAGTYYYEHIAVQQYDIDLHTGLNITYKASPRLTLTSNIDLAYLTEPDFSYGAGINQRVGNYFYTNDQFTIAYEWLPRFSTATSYTVNALNYDDKSVGQFQDRVENTFGNQFRFQLVPTSILVAEYRYQIDTYRFSGNDSTTHYLLGGIDHTFTPRLMGSLRAGLQFREYDQSPNRTEPYVEGTATYTSGKRSSVSWTLRYGLEDPDVPQQESRTTFRTGLQIQQELMPRISAQLGLFYQHDDNKAFSGSALNIPSFTQDSYNISISVRYAITHYLAAEAGYNYSDVSSSQSEAVISALDYNRNRVFAGVNFAF